MKIKKVETILTKHFKIPNCPNCKIELNEYYKIKYCKECGQMLDWSEFENE